MSKFTQKVVLILPNIPAARNTTRYQRVATLAEAFDLTVLLECGSVPPELKSRARFLVNPVKRRLVRSLLFPLWGGLVLFSLRHRGIGIVVSSFHSSATLLGFFARRLMHSKWVADIYDLPDLELEVSNSAPRFERILRKGVFRMVSLVPHRLYRTADCIVCTILPEALARYRIPENKITHLTNGVELERICLSTGESKIKRKAFRILYVGFVLRIRGVDTILRAALELRDRHPEIEWTLVGKTTTGDAAWLESEIWANGLSERIKILGQRPHEEVLQLVNSADVCLFPFPKSDATDFIYPIKIFEYMAHGKAIVATNLQGVCRVLRHQVSALLVRPGDSKELADAVERLYVDRTLLQFLGKNAKRDVVKYDWATINRQLVATLRG